MHKHALMKVGESGLAATLFEKEIDKVLAKTVIEEVTKTDTGTLACQKRGRAVSGGRERVSMEGR